MHWSDEQCRSFLILNDLTLNTIKYVLHHTTHRTFRMKTTDDIKPSLQILYPRWNKAGDGQNGIANIELTNDSARRWSWCSLDVKTVTEGGHITA